MSLESLTVALVVYFIGFAVLSRSVRGYRYKRRLYEAQIRRKKSFSGQGYDIFDSKDPLTELKFGDLTKQPGNTPFVPTYKAFHSDSSDL